jgi:hypothetical protein
MHLVEVDMRTQVGRERWDKAHPVSRWRDGERSMIDTDLETKGYQLYLLGNYRSNSVGAE